MRILHGSLVDLGLDLGPCSLMFLSMLHCSMNEFPAPERDTPSATRQFEIQVQGLDGVFGPYVSQT